MSGLNIVTPQNYPRMRWCVLAAEFYSLRRWAEMTLDHNISEDELLAYGAKHRIAELMDTIAGVEAGTLPAEALDEFKEEK